MAFPLSDYQQQPGYAVGGTAKCPERNPDSISGRLDQLIYGLNNSLHQANQVHLKMWGPTPEACGNAINQTLDPCVNVQIDMLQAKVSELQRSLENILKAF